MKSAPQVDAARVRVRAIRPHFPRRSPSPRSCGGMRCRANSDGGWSGSPPISMRRNPNTASSPVQGELHRDRDRGDLCVPLAQPAGDRSGQRNRHRDHDGGAQGRDLSGVRTDARSVGAVYAGRLSAGHGRLLQRRCRQHVVLPVQCLDADPVLQQKSFPHRRSRSRRRAEDLARARRRGETAARGRRGLRVHHGVAFLDQCRKLSPPFTICRSRRRKRLRRARCGAHFQQSSVGASHRAARGVADHQGVRVQRPRHHLRSPGFKRANAESS